MSTSFSMSYKEIGLLSAGVSESMRQRTEILGDGESRWGRQRQQAGGSEHERLVDHQRGDVWLKDFYSFCSWLTVGSIPLFLNLYKMYDVHITSISNSLKRNKMSPVFLIALPGGSKILV